MARDRLNAGHLDRRITIEAPASEGDAYGQRGRKKGTWVPWKTRLAAGKDIGTGKEGFGEGQETASLTTRWRIRYCNPAPTSAMRLYDEAAPGQYYELVAPPREIGRRGGWELLTQLRI